MYIKSDRVRKDVGGQEPKENLWPTKTVIVTPMQSVLLDYEAGKFFRLIEEMNRRSTAAVRTPIGFNSLLKVETEERQGPVPDRSLFNSAVDIMRKQLSKAGDAVTFASSSATLQHVVNLVSKLAAMYSLRLRPDKCMQMWISARPLSGIRVNGQPIELVDEFCYSGCIQKNDGTHEVDILQRCANATCAFNSSKKVFVVDLIGQRSQGASLPIRNSPYYDERIGDLGSAVNGDGET
ncbi:hypothetical protein RB195_021903 [Necator americanus]|uniref:Uncharacterized protein n=1 Tax=Necator americanus TaxID=51031 RepID=A0ABR1ED32_NECAM